MKRIVLTFAAVAVVAASAGCSNGSSDLTRNGQQALQPYVIRLRAAAAGTDVSAVRSAVRQLQDAVHTQLDKGRLSNSRASDIDNAATALLNDFRAFVRQQATPSQTPTSPTPSSPTPTSPTPSSQTPTTTQTETAPSTPTHTRTVTVPPPSLLSPDESSSSTSQSRRQ